MHDIRHPIAPRHGELIAGSYVLGELLGVGGMGVVYAATQRSLERKVAIKLLHPDFASDPAMRRGFRAEALAGARINHQNVVHVFDFGNDAAGVPWLAMEHVVGPLLGQVIAATGPFGIAAALALIRGLLAGLEATHEASIVYADVKCDNILVETHRDGTVVARLIDFGIARFIDEPYRPCPIGERFVAGTPEYLAPELVRGEPPTFASDVYATGIVLYELLTGVTPFGGGAAGTIMDRQCTDAPIPPSCRAPSSGITRALDELIGRALAKHPDDRFDDAASFADALEDPALVSDRAPRHHQDPRVPFSTEAPTSPLPVRDVRVAIQERMREHWRALDDALLCGDGDAIVVAYLDLARTLIEQRRLAAAIVELEAGVAHLASSTAPTWRLMLSLAALYDGVGERTRARATTAAARAHAIDTGSTLGRDRCDELMTRLARVSGSPRARVRDDEAEDRGGAASRGRHRRIGRWPRGAARAGRAAARR